MDSSNPAPASPAAPRAVLSRFRRDSSGATAVEFAFVAVPFFFLCFAIIETALATAAGVVLNNAVNDAARSVMTGEVQRGDMDGADFRERICGDLAGMMSCANLKLDMRTYPAGERIPNAVRIKKGSVDDEGFCFNPGSQESITVIRAYYEWPWATGFLSRLAEDTNGNAILSAMAAFMNEPFGGASNPNANC